MKTSSHKKNYIPFAFPCGMLLCSVLLCMMLMTACGRDEDDGVSLRAYRIGTEVADIAERYVNQDLDAETVNNKIVPLSLDAERVDSQLYEYITAIIGDICDGDTEKDGQTAKDIQALCDYIGYTKEKKNSE